eukprot:CAMPEP_0170558100 /NCGR_PEP_ID=MMETSP0211-20121228/32653_1 /TAXON_ID=311385 /ORGANISM="Pseudokeronopsis sp., Strain OXSARD2" /LENGTH=69 /DNA_ID=CAMNT_0010869697 /DNA_START=64 /DNA_END=270 /DNA_ORIENTATION=-
MKKQAEAILKELKEKFGQEGMTTIIKNTFCNEGEQIIAEKLIKLLTEKAKSKADQSKDFRNFLKQQKEQ